jgi:transposase InsO family protein
MPWKECSQMSQRKEFVTFALQQGLCFNELCRRFGISRKTGYKWVQRYCEGGNDQLLNQSRRPLSSPLSTPSEVELKVLEIRSQFHWGGRKIRDYLLNMGYCHVPASSTITRILHRHNRISDDSTEKSKRWNRFERKTPNDLWQMDFKGHFAVGKKRCHPLTVIDDHSRYCIRLQSTPAENSTFVKPALVDAFRIYGLPMQINTDNGAPWGHCGPKGMSRFGAWLIRLGIKISYSSPGHPQTNGKDERFNRTLKAEVLQANAFINLKAVQDAFDYWRPIYNNERPHDSLGGKAPVSRYTPSDRPYPEKLPPIEYSSNDFIRKVQNGGIIWFKGGIHFISEALIKEPVAVRPTITDGVWEVYYVRQKVKTIDLRKSKK